MNVKTSPSVSRDLETPEDRTFRKLCQTDFEMIREEVAAHFAGAWRIEIEDLRDFLKKHNWRLSDYMKEVNEVLR